MSAAPRTHGETRAGERPDPVTGFLAATGWAGAARRPLAGDASARRYLRLDGGPRPALVMIAPPELCGPLAPFLGMTAHLRAIGLRAPEIFAEDASEGLLLIEDFGDALLARRADADPAQAPALYARAVDVLIHLHGAPLPDRPTVGAEDLAAMLAPLFEHYAPGFARSEAVITELADRLAALPDWTPRLALRDYHAENLVALDPCCGLRGIGLLDYQDAILTHPAYDLASLLQDARRDVPEALETEMIARFLAGTGAAPGAFRAAYPLIALQRNLRILGIFARLSRERPQARYERFQPRVWAHVQRMLAAPGCDGLRLLLADLPPPAEAGA